MKTSVFICSAAVAAAIGCGCTPTLKTENEVTIKPIQITLDVNLKVDQELTKALSSDTAGKGDSNSNDPRERRRARRDQIQAWKSAQLIGEANNGLLEIPGSGNLSAAVSKVVDAENADRKQVFAQIAEKQNLPAESIAQRWANRMAERAPEGVYLQDASGNWTVKSAK